MSTDDMMQASSWSSSAPDDSWIAPDLEGYEWLRVNEHPALPNGGLALVDPGAIRDAELLLHPAERALADALPAVKRASFIAGRVALRAAIHRASTAATTTPLLRDQRGAPMMPGGLLGSISHKRSIAVAVAAPSRTGSTDTVGIDVEERSHLRRRLRDIAPRILIEREFELLNPGSEAERHESVVLLFAMKEAVYKAIDPFVHRHVRFQEVEIEPADSLLSERGTARVAMMLPEFAEHSPSVSVHWWKDETHLFAIATGTKREG